MTLSLWTNNLYKNEAGDEILYQSGTKSAYVCEQQLKYAVLPVYVAANAHKKIMNRGFQYTVTFMHKTKLVVVRREDRNEKHGSVTLYIAMGIGLRQNLFVLIMC